MKKENRIIIIVLAIILTPIILCISLYLSIVFRMNAVNFPEGTEIIETKISASDIYGWHILCEKLVCSDMDFDCFSEYVIGTSDSDTSVFLVYENNGIYEIEWDDWGIDLNCIKGKEKKDLYYYLIQVTLPH